MFPHLFLTQTLNKSKFRGTSEFNELKHYTISVCLTRRTTMFTLTLQNKQQNFSSVFTREIS